MVSIRWCRAQALNRFWVTAPTLRRPKHTRPRSSPLRLGAAKIHGPGAGPGASSAAARAPRAVCILTRAPHSISVQHVRAQGASHPFSLAVLPSGPWGKTLGQIYEPTVRNPRLFLASSRKATSSRKAPAGLTGVTGSYSEKTTP